MTLLRQQAVFKVRLKPTQTRTEVRSVEEGSAVDGERLRASQVGKIDLQAHRRPTGFETTAAFRYASFPGQALAMGGDWHDLAGALADDITEPVALQPLSRIDDAGDRACAAESVAALLARESVTVEMAARWARRPTTNFIKHKVSN